MANAHKGGGRDAGRGPAEPKPQAPVVLCLLRHGDAGSRSLLPRHDEERPLTTKGRKQARRAGKALRRLRLSPAACLTSRLARARETADLALRACRSGVKASATAALAPSADPGAVLAEVPARGVVWLVGHDPHLSRLLERLTGAPAGAAPMGKGALAVLDCGPAGPRPGRCRLVALYPADGLRALLRARRR